MTDVPAPSLKQRLTSAAACAIIPVLALAIGSATAWAAGARWVAVYYDPDYHYLLNALSLAEGHSPYHVDHPGTPLQTLGAGVLLVWHWLTGTGSLRHHVLREPEAALSAISITLRTLHALALYLLGVRVWRLTGSLGCGIAAQAATLLSMIGLVSLWRVSPEPLVMTLVLLLSCATIRAVSPGPVVRRRMAVIAGIIAGLGAATKATFLPLWAVPLAALAGRRTLIIYLAAVPAAMAIALTPIVSQHARMLGWFKGLLLGDGVYGKTHGNLVIDPSRYPGNFWRMVVEEPAGIVGAALALGLVLHVLGFGAWRSLDSRQRSIARSLAIVAGVQLLQYVLVAKHPGDRYLLPGLTLLGLNVALGYALVKAAYGARSRRAIACAGLAIICGYGAWLGVRLEHRLSSMRADSRARIALHELALQTTKDDGVLACSYAASSPVFAMVFADWWTKNRFGADLREMYPGQWNYNIWGDTFSVGARQLPRRLGPEEAARGRLWFQGPLDVLPKDFNYQELRTAGDEGLYFARPKAP